MSVTVYPSAGDTKKNDPDNMRYYSLGGWLLFFCIANIVFLLRYVIGIFMALSLGYSLAVVLTLPAIGICVFIIMRTISRQKKAPDHIRNALVVDLVLRVAIFVWGLMSASLSSTALVSMVFSFVWLLIWFPYFAKSQRVRGTYFS